MDPHNFIARAEAQRWLGIAEKLLIGNDLVGSKTFALRARDSDPRLESADQILAIADTLLAADKRLLSSDGSQQPDFYNILQLARFVQDPDHITSQYRRLAVLLNPHQNRFPYADQAFQLVNEAWDVLSNPMRKSLYDSDVEYPQQINNNNNNSNNNNNNNNINFGFSIEHQNQHQHQQQQQNHQQQHQHNFFSVQPRVQVIEPGHQQQQLHQHNFLSQNPVRGVQVGQLFQHGDHGQVLFQQQVQPFQVTVVQQQQQPTMQATSPVPAATLQTPFSWPQALPLSQPQLFQKQQQQEAIRQEAPSHIGGNNDVREEETEMEADVDAEAENRDDSPTFWTTCPYCYYMYEYPKQYVECVLRCETCERAFQAVRISSPPPISEDQESYYYCWGFFPLAISMSDLQKKDGDKQTKSSWAPFSPMCDVSSHVKEILNAKEHLNEKEHSNEEHSNEKEHSNEEEHLNEKSAPKKKVFANPNLGPTIYIDDETDDIFEGISEPSDDSDIDWGSIERKKAKRVKKDRVRGNRNVNTRSSSSLPASKKSSGVTTRRQSVRAAKEMGRLDLNVEFNNNESEEPAARAGTGNRGNGQGDGDNMEGIGFFEGLDEFFSSLPILSVVNDDKVKAA